MGPERFDGGQGETARIPYADGTLVKLPVTEDSALIPDLLTLSDVLCTGYHAARTARVTAGETVDVIGDGPVGLCAVISARLLGAGRIILMDRHTQGTDLGREFGATDVVAARSQDATRCSASVIRFSCARPGAARFAELQADKVHEITLNDRWLDPEQVCADGRVTLDGLEESNELRVVAGLRRPGLRLLRLLTRTEGFLAAPDRDPGLARIVTECRDVAGKSLRARTR